MPLALDMAVGDFSALPDDFIYVFHAAVDTGAGDYPRWTFDDPRWLVKHLPEHARENIMFRNGIATYHLPDTVPALEGQVRVF